jgi:Domain of unknown function (DUF4292)
MKVLKFLLVVAIAFSMVKCRSGKALTKALAPKDTTLQVQIKNVADSLLLVKETKSVLQKSTIDFKTFSAKIKMDIETSKEKIPDLLANVRILKDSIIWVSVSATIFNYEVARLFITKDSVIFVNKKDKEVSYRSISYLQELTDIPFDLKELQNLLVGNPIFFNENNMTVKKFEKILLIASLGNDFKSLTTLSLPQNLLQHCKLDDVDVMQNRTADVTYDDYKNENGIAFSTRRQIIASEKNKLDIRMNFKQYEFNKELSVSFNVPKNYKKK